jgi:hypothetical protein
MEDKTEKYPQVNYAQGIPQSIKFKASTLSHLIEKIKIMI